MYWWNTEKIKEKNTPVFYSIAGLSVFHTYTIVPLYSIIYVLIYKTYSLEGILTLSPFVIINIIVFIIDFITSVRLKLPDIQLVRTIRTG